MVKMEQKRFIRSSYMNIEIGGKKRLRLPKEPQLFKQALTP